MPSPLRYLTLNLRNLMDRWPERLPLLLAEFSALQPDVAGLQEVVFPLQQDRLLGASGEGQYHVRRVWSWRPEVGNSLLVREPVAFGLAPETAADRLDLGHLRAAGRAELVLNDERLRVVNLHLHHENGPEHDRLRLTQAEAALAWLAAMPPVEATIVSGDFNATPSQPTYARMVEAGFRSAFAEANGAEPDVTWPSGLQAPGMDIDGEPGCLDYIWVMGAITVTSARLCFDRPATDDATLYPSDHRGVTADLEVGA